MLLYILNYINYTSDKMNINAPDAELADLIQRPDVTIPNNNVRANPVGQQLQPRQPQIRPFVNHWTPNMPANGGYRRSKNSKKYKNKNRKYKNKNRKRRQTKRFMKKRNKINSS